MVIQGGLNTVAGLAESLFTPNFSVDQWRDGEDCCPIVITDPWTHQSEISSKLRITSQMNENFLLYFI